MIFLQVLVSKENYLKDIFSSQEVQVKDSLSKRILIL